MARRETTAQPQRGTRPGGLFDPARPSHRWWVAATVAVSGLLVSMNQTAMQIALPQIMTVFGLNLDQAQWLVIAYVIAGAMLVPAVGWLGNRLGNRTLYLLALAVFVTGSALCALAWSGPSLITFRMMQGLGGGPIPPMTMLFLSSVFPPAQRGRAMGLFGMGQTAGPILGTVLGGYLTEYLSWRMVFLLNVVPGLVCVVLVLLVLPNVREAAQQAFDLAGLLTLGIGLVSLLVALSWGQQEGWDAPLIQRLLLLAGAAFVAFLACELLTDAPLVDLQLYRNVTFSAVSGVMLLYFMVFTASTFLAGDSDAAPARLYAIAGRAGPVARVPGPVLEFPTGRPPGRPLRPPLHDACSPQRAHRGVVSLHLPPPRLAAALDGLAGRAALRLWQLRLHAPARGGAVASPPEKVRMGSGLLNLMQNGLGNTLGLALVTTVLARRLTYHHSTLDQHQAVSSLSWGEVLAPVHLLVQQAGTPGQPEDLQVLALVSRHLEQQVSVAAYQDCFMLVTLLSLLSLPLVLLMRRPAA